ncbi:hypothetical protein BYT27DRAFT_7193959 [Phlegmacium glaucopus]|nr:hypothetical protein BYT27DRAFT_7193959 [Phlegmacium glaucopus]
MRPAILKSTWTRLRWWQRLPPTRRCISSDVVTLPQLSAVHQGNAFEERSLGLLHQTMSMSLKRVGGKEDGGIDLLGWWWLPEGELLLDSSDATTTTSSLKRRRIRVIGQCKAEKRKTGPKYVRELEGVLFRFLTMSGSLDVHNPPADPESVALANSEASQFPIIALLISESEFTKSAILRANSSPIPFFLLHLPAIDNPDGIEDDDLGNLGMAICNPALCGTDGLLKGRMEMRWDRHEFGGGGRPVLWWGNQKLYSWTPELGNTPKPIITAT